MFAPLLLPSAFGGVCGSSHRKLVCLAVAMLWALHTNLQTPMLAKYSYYFAAVASGILAILTANYLWSKGIKKISPSRTANYNNLVPILAFIISYFTLNEYVLPIQYAGAAVTIIGVWFAK
ncbi:MAG: DMT family transporter [Bacteroidota bacterium]|nr:DMT family transporter [Bacteroidota bacterium]